MAPSGKFITPLTNVTYVEISSRAEDIRAGLIDTFLNLERIDTDLYLARHLLKERVSFNAVYGGQVVGQSLAAAAATVDEKFIPHSLHSYFIKQGNVDKPILYMIDRIRDGRSFVTRIVKAVQDGEAIFSCQISFHKKEPNEINHQDQIPKVPAPETLVDVRAVAKEHLANGNGDIVSAAVIEYIKQDIPPAFERIFDVRPVNPKKFFVGEDVDPSSCFWIKTKEDIGADHRLHQCVAAYLTDLNMLYTTLLPHLRTGIVPSMTFSLDHCIWLHDPQFRVDDWLLYETVSHGSRALIEGRLWTKDGRLVASTAQEALVRTFPTSKT